MVKVYSSSPLREQLTERELQGLVRDFKVYKITGQSPALFGRDVLFDHPHTLPILVSEQVRHVHLLPESERPSLSQKDQFNRTSDQHLIYCEGFKNTNAYLLIAILRPNAHEQERNNEVMYRLGLMAEKFRARF